MDFQKQKNNNWISLPGWLALTAKPRECEDCYVLQHIPRRSVSL